jgi:glycosyltransferase involved in cell wall biosynthesis
VTELAGTAPIVGLSVIVLTFNEARNLPRCLASVAGLAERVFVVDSGSTDGTPTVAETLGARVYQHPFEGHAAQWNWAFRNLPLQPGWILALDADHRLTPALVAELRELFARGIPRELAGYYVTRRQIFRGRWIRHGGYYPKRLLKLVRAGAVSSDERERLDFRLYVEGPTALLANDILEDNENEREIEFFITKHLRFASLQAAEELERRNGSAYRITPSPFGSPDARTLFLKRIWYRLPLYVRPTLYFLYRYLVRLGFLDGKEGFVFHFLQAFWYRVLVDIRIEELGRAADAESRRAGAAEARA